MRLHSVPTSAQTQTTSTGTADTKTITPPSGAIAFLISVETTNARMTFDGSAPSSTNGHVIQKDQQPTYMPLSATVLKFVAAAAANSIVNITWLFS